MTKNYGYDRAFYPADCKGTFELAADTWSALDSLIVRSIELLPESEAKNNREVWLAAKNMIEDFQNKLLDHYGEDRVL